MPPKTRRPPIPPQQTARLDIAEADFQRWKHHPVTKVVMGFLRDRERQIAEHMVAQIRNANGPLGDFDQGAFQSHINTLRELSELEFGSIEQFYAEEVGEVDDA